LQEACESFRAVRCGPEKPERERPEADPKGTSSMQSPGATTRKGQCSFGDKDSSHLHLIFHSCASSEKNLPTPHSLFLSPSRRHTPIPKFSFGCTNALETSFDALLPSTTNSPRQSLMIAFPIYPFSVAQWLSCHKGSRFP